MFPQILFQTRNCCIHVSTHITQSYRQIYKKLLRWRKTKINTYARAMRKRASSSDVDFYIYIHTKTYTLLKSILLHRTQLLNNAYGTCNIKLFFYLFNKMLQCFCVILFNFKSNRCPFQMCAQQLTPQS